ncbi:MAG: hypothetical protein J0H82_30085 [Alphaproteobacteria bacterium]|jgi:hypothetical protein|nr:hypothetical protein [Alphaproteobacteria bacterium]
MLLLELVIYILALYRLDQPFDCKAAGENAVTCSNGHAARLLADGRFAFDDGAVTLKKAADGIALGFSNGITGRFDSFGWLEFSNGIGIRRMSDGTFHTTSNMACAQILPDQAQCTRISP